MTGRAVVETAVETTGLSREQLLELYRLLRLTRELEQTLANLYRQNKVIGGLYRSLGQEGEAVATAFALRRRHDGTGDIISPGIRNLGALLAMGAPPAAVLRQYMAKGDSPSGGREQNVHFTDYDRGYIGLISHLGVMVEVMAGVALSFKLRRQDRVALVYSGDGMTSTGAFHEGLNLAAVRRAPLVVVVESNGYAYSTPTWKQSAVSSFVDKAPGYGVRGESCDGNDVPAVYAAARRAVEHARSGAGPALLEVITYRRKGHAEHDTQSYVPAGELDEWEARDPIDRYRGWLRDALGDAEALAAVDADVHEVVNVAREEAEASGLPAPTSGGTNVYAGGMAMAPWTRLATPDPHRS
jgi:TPP-dependent pyruvate/acetoin dehydrogenase alpha subunit